VEIAKFIAEHNVDASSIQTRYVQLHSMRPSIADDGGKEKGEEKQ
jgi:hypothetical protein